MFNKVRPSVRTRVNFYWVFFSVSVTTRGKCTYKLVFSITYLRINYKSVYLHTTLMHINVRPLTHKLLTVNFTKTCRNWKLHTCTLSWSVWFSHITFTQPVESSQTKLQESKVTVFFHNIKHLIYLRNNENRTFARVSNLRRRNVTTVINKRVAGFRKNGEI